MDRCSRPRSSVRTLRPLLLRILALRQCVSSDKALPARAADGDSASLSALGASFKASEAEFAFVMKTDLPPRDAPYSEEEVWGAVAAVAPAIELASARLLFAAPPVAVLADGAWNGCFVLGRRVPPSDVPGGAASLASAGAALLVNGAEVAANTGANVLGNPLTALVSSQQRFWLHHGLG
jgi:2-keto-4-pentenoate hydratase